MIRITSSTWRLALSHKKDVPGALRAIAQTIRLRPQDTEAQAFQATLRAEPPHAAAASAPASGRVNTAFDPTAAAENAPLGTDQADFQRGLLPPGGL